MNTVKMNASQTNTAKMKMLLEVTDLQTQFRTDEGTVRAVDGVSFKVERGKTLGILGESGCGKSVLGFSILRLVQPPGQIVGGSILYHFQDGKSVDIARLEPRSKAIRELRGGHIGMIFQEPMTSLDPLYSVGQQFTEALLQHRKVSKKEARDEAVRLLGKVGLPEPSAMVDRYPHQLSGGQRQRVMIAIALSCRPSLLIADEPTTALDVTTEAQIIDLLKALQQDLGMAMVFITHDLGVIGEVADETIVMYLGKIVERAPVKALFEAPKHPYTQALLASVPKLGQKTSSDLKAIQGMVPGPQDRPTGCPFHPRCPQAIVGVCDRETPPTVRVNESEVSCVLYSGTVSKGAA
jgi:oligopeptide/dipeptide ABC transporter ATP-binding protein